MRLTKQSNYAVRLLMYCATNEGQISRVSEIARVYGISDLFLFKILQPLVQAGLVETIRGRSGGIRLAKSSDEITLFQVVRITEENFVLSDHLEGDGDCPSSDKYGVSTVFREALSAFFRVLSKYSIADLVAAQPNILTLLDLEPKPCTEA
ncbi:iron-responsive transcriptional regulator RirA [Brucella pseudogrignonensis]|uniref:iron-responsive transcriptional regulator RirA n=1 Tax=Brucella pseudogrignonensis TaxID=419475 RepID=UPI00201FDE28|nr:iron-responsive transcriptional regulator RirA [Brucella pseudogrignonensis]MCL7999784.1 iron-responsive transcriptional regulator RirA [Brucella sp. 21LCYQ03]MDT6942362.1 iron-responsive transcriptional regulator RirA [Brucella pseudogrignonensis]